MWHWRKDLHILIIHKRATSLKTQQSWIVSLVEESESGLFILTCLFLLAAVLGQALKCVLVWNKTLSYLPVFFLLSALPFLAIWFHSSETFSRAAGRNNRYCCIFRLSVKSWTIKSDSSCWKGSDHQLPLLTCSGEKQCSQILGLQEKWVLKEWRTILLQQHKGGDSGMSLRSPCQFKNYRTPRKITESHFQEKKELFVHTLHYKTCRVPCCRRLDMQFVYAPKENTLGENLLMTTKCKGPFSYLGNSQPTSCWMLGSVSRKYCYIFVLSLRSFWGVHCWRQDADSHKLFSCWSQGMAEGSRRGDVCTAWCTRARKRKCLGWSQRNPYFSGKMDAVMFCCCHSLHAEAAVSVEIFSPNGDIEIILRIQTLGSDSAWWLRVFFWMLIFELVETGWHDWHSNVAL